MEFDFAQNLKESLEAAKRIQASIQENMPLAQDEAAVTSFINKVSMEEGISYIQGPVPMYETKEAAIEASYSKVPILIYYFENNIIRKMGLE